MTDGNFVNIYLKQYSISSPVYVCVKSEYKFLNFECRVIESVINKLKNIWIQAGNNPADISQSVSAQSFTNSSTLSNSLLVNELEQKCITANSALAAIQLGLEKVLNDNYYCAICLEIAVEASGGNCRHIFCRICIEQWISLENKCPVCRCRLSQVSRKFSEYHIIEELIQLLPQDYQTARNNLICERSENLSLAQILNLHEFEANNFNLDV